MSGSNAPYMRQQLELSSQAESARAGSLPFAPRTSGNSRAWSLCRVDRGNERSTKDKVARS